MENIITLKKILKILSSKTKKFTPTLIESIIKEYAKDPFLILICCLLSLRSKDVVTIHICRNLLKKATTPKEILSIPKTELEKIEIGWVRRFFNFIYIILI